MHLYKLRLIVGHNTELDNMQQTLVQCSCVCARVLCNLLCTNEHHQSWNYLYTSVVVHKCDVSHRDESLELDSICEI